MNILKIVVPKGLVYGGQLVEEVAGNAAEAVGEYGVRCSWNQKNIIIIAELGTQHFFVSRQGQSEKTKEVVGER